MPDRKTLAVLAMVITLTSGGVRAEDQKIDCENASTTADMNICAGESFERADAELNRVYSAALAAIPDMAVEDPQFNAKAWESALRKSQRTWLAYRDAECENHVAMFWTNGSGATVDIIGCKQSLTEARTKELKARYEEGESAPAEAAAQAK